MADETKCMFNKNELIDAVVELSFEVHRLQKRIKQLESEKRYLEEQLNLCQK